MRNKRLIKIPYEQEFWIESVFIYRIENTLNKNQIELPDFDRLSNCIIGIDDKFIYNNGDSLSGGERRRTEIARALAVDPKFILLDEPFAGVDPIAVEDIQSVVSRLKLKDIGILITDHNVNETLSICDRAYLLIEGKIFKHGTAEELAADEQVRRLYLGTNFELKRKDWIIEMGQKSKLNTNEAI